ncbi:MAG: 1-acyl-sn-glycerol-3-phosphate acyltransferase [Rhodobiaceae bacterium]|nr:1-acyl-sn-glycerol-3-phosphate acyltransferase [Rhodobiaceae bacterium]MCC0012362.1 1-acyl-sn-glycerol-3-phosphate acyltransferase [Rhodobiaceae bacterium]
MLRVRSALLTALFFLNWIAFVLLGAPLLLMPRRYAIAALKAWGHVSAWLLRVLIGTRVEVRGVEKIPQGPLLVASKHQSAFETFALAPLFDDPVLVLKRELNRIPLFSLWTRKFGMIAVDRSRGVRSLKKLATDAREAFALGRQLIIFPEGTRRTPGAAPDYKIGATYIYDNADVPCLPVALNSGVFWPRRSFLKYPGKIVVEILDPIPPGLDRKAFDERLEQAIEEASDRLLVEAASQPFVPPLPDVAQARLAELGHLPR